MSLYDAVAGLPVAIDSVALERREVVVAGGAFVRATTVVRLRGGGQEGVGEDVTYDASEHDDPPTAPVTGRWGTFDDLSRRLDDVELFRSAPSQPAYLDYRRWAWESAALDLALRQAGRSLADALGRQLRPLTFVVSIRLGQPASAEPVRRWLELYPGLRFKLDPTADWDDALVGELAATGAVDVVDLKGAYRGTPVDNPADVSLYRRVAEGLPSAWIEDPDLDGEPGDALAPYRERITWDAPIHAVADIERLPFEPHMLNVKPSRFGSVERLLAAYEHCERHGIATYGGGQFELGPGRGQIQYLASLFSAEAPNDVAPSAYNEGTARAGLPTSPLAVAGESVGFRWG